MKMANGGCDPAYNVQFASDADSRMIVGVDVTNAGTDGGELAPMLAKVSSDYGKTPENAMVDAAYATKEGVTAVERAGTKVLSTILRAEQLRKHGKDPHARQEGDSDEYANFRARMAQAEYQELYKLRPSIAEFPQRGLSQPKPSAVSRSRLGQGESGGLVACVGLQLHPHDKPGGFGGLGGRRAAD